MTKLEPGRVVMRLFVATACLTASEASPSGIVIGWGSNVSGQATGVPQSAQSAGMVTIAGQVLTNAVAIAAGMDHGLSIRSDGTVVGWGNNGRGQATGIPSPYPGRASGVVRIAGQMLSNVVTVASGWGHSHAIRGDGTIAAWGMQFDDSKMVAFPGVSNTASIAGWWTLAAKSDGTLINTFDGKTYDGITNLIAVAAPRADHGNLVGLQRNGVVVDIRLGNSPSVTVVASNATAITAGRWQNLALKRDGSVFAWGSQNHVPSGLSNVVAISAGEYHSLALRSDGTVVAWGATDRPAAHVPEGLTNVVAIAAGNDFSLAITTNAAVAERFRH